MPTFWDHADVILRLHGVAMGQGLRLILPRGIEAKQLESALIIPCAFDQQMGYKPLLVIAMVLALNDLDDHEVQFDTGTADHPHTGAAEASTLFFTRSGYTLGPPQKVRALA